MSLFEHNLTRFLYFVEILVDFIGKKSALLDIFFLIYLFTFYIDLIVGFAS
jgi:hypothetical protein